ncbi:MAG: hypothetical protein QM496_11995 [Verrucomicrobiota bacterium]
MKEILLAITRELTFQKEGEKYTGFLRINRLYFDENSACWRCDWSIDHLYPEAVHFPGVDPLEALSRTLDFAASFILGSSTDKLKIHWQYDDDLGGLEFPQSESGQWKLPPATQSPAK